MCISVILWGVHFQREGIDVGYMTSFRIVFYLLYIRVSFKDGESQFVDLKQINNEQTQMGIALVYLLRCY